MASNRSVVKLLTGPHPHRRCVMLTRFLLVVAVAIQTAAMDMLGGDGIGKQCRTADIVADAAYAILSRPKDYTGNFLVDEDILKEEGIKDFDQYAIQPGENAN